MKVRTNLSGLGFLGSSSRLLDARRRDARPLRAWRPPSRELCVLDTHGCAFPSFFSCELDVTRATHVSTAPSQKKVKGSTEAQRGQRGGTGCA